MTCYSETEMFGLSKKLHSAVENSLTFENQVHILPGKELFVVSYNFNLLYKPMALQVLL